MLDTHKQLWFIFQNDQLVLAHQTSLKIVTEVTVTTLTHELRHQYTIAEVNGIPICCGEISPDYRLPETLTPIPLRQALDELGLEWYNLTNKAHSIITWDKNHRYCGQCGTVTLLKGQGFERCCPSCRLSFYPRISPSVIVLIHRGDDILMARGPHFTKGAYGLIAGFVEAGESVEDTIHREVMEEVGIHIKNIDYFGSQSWPFPDSLMLGFFAEYDSGEIRIDTKEIETAGWYRYDQIPGLPSSRRSIAHKLIDHFINSRK